MASSVRADLLTFLDQHPQSILHDECELCGGQWLITISNRDRYGLPGRFTLCRQCGLVTQNPRWDRAAYGEFYSRFYRPLIQEYYGSVPAPTGMENAREFFENIANAVGLRRHLPDRPKVLDIGGGTGWLGQHLRDEYAADVTIVEPNSVEAEEAIAGGFEVHVDVLEDAELPEAAFDLVVMLRTVDHLVDAAEAFTTIRRTLKEGGLFLVDGADFFRRMSFLSDPVKPLKIDHCYYYSVETMTLMMRKFGLHSIVSDLVVWEGEVVNLARAGEPVQIEANGVHPLPGGEARFGEWERLANRPHYESRPGYLIRSVKGEIKWLGRKLKGKR